MTPSFKAFSWLLAVLGLSITPATALTPVNATGLGLLVPAYFYPGADASLWAALTRAAREVPVTAILNPASGPGRQTDPNYRRAVGALRWAGGKVVGYVHTQYGKRNLNDVAAEINRYANLYEIDGIFIDEMAADSDPSTLLYFESLYQLIKSLHVTWIVIGNPGVYPARTQLDLPTADTFVQFEQSGSAWRSRQAPQWPADYGPERFAELVHSADDPSLVDQMVEQAVQHRVGQIYITDDLMDNPWDELPSWWDHLVEQVRRHVPPPR